MGAIRQHEPKRVSVRTTAAEGHQHVATVDEEGRGRTDWADGHFHFVEGLDVRPAAEGGHTHELTDERIQ